MRLCRSGLRPPLIAPSSPWLRFVGSGSIRFSKSARVPRYERRSFLRRIREMAQPCVV